MRWILRVALMVVVVMGARSAAEACSCGMPGIAVMPSAKVKVPRNVQVRVSWPLPPVGRTGGMPQHSIYRDLPVDRGPWTAAVALVTSTGEVVPSDRQTLASGEQGLLLLTPHAPLAAAAEYRVVFEPKAAKPMVLGAITTGDFIDDKPPEWEGVDDAMVVQGPGGCCDCSTADAFAWLSLTKHPHDDRAEDRELWFAVWPSKGKLDNSTLLAVVSWRRDRIVLGHDSMCALSNFDVSTTTPTTLRIAPIDLAGNAGLPLKVTIRLPKP